MENRPLSAWAEDFILHKRNLGYGYGKSAVYYVARYVKYAEALSPNISIPDKGTVQSFMKTLSGSPGSLYNAVAHLREFANYLSMMGAKDAYVIPPKSTPSLDPDPPYFFTESEIEQFFAACDAVRPHERYPGRELVCPALFRLLHCCGLRCMEARALLCANVRLDEGYLDIIQSKGPKSRRIFISGELADYLSAYDKAIGGIIPGRKYFFPHGSDGCYGSVFVSNNFKKFWKQAFPGFALTNRPRAYDFRHHFVWANMNSWAQEGMDLNSMLLYLARYMGHAHIRSTLYYFRFVPEFFPTYSSMAQALESILPEVGHEE